MTQKDYVSITRAAAEPGITVSDAFKARWKEIGDCVPADADKKQPQTVELMGKSFKLAYSPQTKSWDLHRESLPALRESLGYYPPFYSREDKSKLINRLDLHRKGGFTTYQNAAFSKAWQVLTERADETLSPENPHVKITLGDTEFDVYKYRKINQDSHYIREDALPKLIDYAKNKGKEAITKPPTVSNVTNGYGAMTYYLRTHIMSGDPIDFMLLKQSFALTPESIDALKELSDRTDGTLSFQSLVKNYTPRDFKGSPAEQLACGDEIRAFLKKADLEFKDPQEPAAPNTKVSRIAKDKKLIEAPVKDGGRE
jgi:hypothetical protein